MRLLFLSKWYISEYKSRGIKEGAESANLLLPPIGDISLFRFVSDNAGQSATLKTVSVS